MTLRKLPAVVYLPCGVTLHPSEVRSACGNVSRAALLYWRRHHDMPAPYGLNNQSYHMAAEIQEWLESRNVTVKWL